MVEKHNKANWRDHWDNHARQWSIIGSPLRPCAEDIHNIKSAIKGTEGLILGATPELASLTGSTTSVDHNSKMIEKLDTGKSKLIFGEWLDLPFEENKFDYAAGDGSLTMLSYPLEYDQLCKQLQKVLKPNARIGLRLFCTPEKGEDIKDVLADAYAGNIGSFHAFKWRFVMAIVAANKTPNINVSQVYDKFADMVIDRNELAKSASWPLEDINTIDVYKNSSVIYSFPTLNETSRLMEKYFKKISVAYGTYELAERCPVASFETI